MKSSTSTTTGTSKNLRMRSVSMSKRAKVLMWAVGPVAAVLSCANVMGAASTWNGGSSIPTNNWSDGGNWGGTAPISGASLIFDGTTNLITNNDFSAFSFAGITFNSTAGAFTLGGNNITLTGPITNNALTAETISLAIGGTSGLSYTGSGTLNLSGANTYTGTTTISSGTIVLNTGGTLGAVTNGLVIGTTANSTATANTATGALVLNTSATIGALTVSTFNTAANTITINGSSVLTVNGVSNIGLADSSATAPTTALTITGNEMDVNNTMNIGLAETGANRSTTNLDMSGLSVFKMTATGSGQNFNVGAVQEASGTVKLANTANTITTNTINISVTTANAGSDTLDLGNGTNVLNANNIIIGQGKGSGFVQFLGSTGSVTITGTAGGASTANITIGNETSATGSSSNNILALAQHLATVQANTVIVGQLAGATAGAPTGSITFDTGNLTINSLQIANDASGTAANGVVGTVTIGGTTPNNTATGIMTVNTAFSLTNITTTTANANATVAKGSFIMNGGTANINADITVNKAANASVNANANTTLTLAGGTLNMMGHQIAPVSGTNIALTTLNLPNTNQTATLMNLGGTGINGAGLNMNGNGTLIMAGNSTFTPATTVTSGALSVTGSLLSTGTVNVNGGALAGTGSVGNVVLGGGGIHPGISANDGSVGNLTMANLTVNSGDYRVDATSGGSDLISVSGTATFNGAATVTVAPIGLANGNYTILSAGSLVNASSDLSLTSTTVGRSTLALDFLTNPNAVMLDVTGSPANLTWNNNPGGGDGTTWDIQNNQNWNSSAPSNPFLYFDGDNVTFNDNNNSANNTNAYNVVLNSVVNPGSVNVNTAAAYTISGGGSIQGSTGLTVSGGGSLTLSTINAYTGNTTVSGAGTTLVVNSLVAGTSNLGSTASLTLDGGEIKWVGGATQSTTVPIIITPNGATFDATPTAGSGQGITYAGTITMSGSGARTITLTGTDTTLATQQISGSIVDAGGATNIVKNGGNSWTLNAANNYSGGTAINAGRLRATNASAFGSGNVTVANGGEVYLNVAGTFSNNFSIAGIGVLESNSTVSSGALRLGTNGAIVSGKVTLTGDARISGRSATTGATISGQITGSQNLEFGNAGSLGVVVLSNATNNWTGNTTISLGTLKAGASSGATTGVIPHGAGAGNVILNGIVQDGSDVGSSTLDVNGFNVIINGLNSAGTVAQQVVTNSSTTAIGTLTVGDNNANSNYTGAIVDGASKATAIAKIGSGNLLLSGSNTFTGGLTVNAGTVQAGSGNAFGGGTLTVNSGTADLNGQSTTVGDLAGTGGTVTNNLTGGPVVLSVGTANNTNYAGAITDGAGGIFLSKFGTGILTLSGANTYSGDTNIYQGALSVTGSLKSTGNVNVNSGGVLMGTGPVGNVNLNGGTISPGATAGVTATPSMANLSVSSGNILIDINGGTSDSLAVGGAAAFNGSSTITVESNSVNVPTGSYNILTSGNLTGVTPTLVAPAGRQVFTLNFNTTIPNDIVLNVSGSAIGNITWNNAGGTGDGVTWDVQNNQNWHNGASPDVFFPIDNVTFNDNNNFGTGAGQNPNAYAVSLNSTVTPSSVTVNTANTYTMSGGGVIAGSGSLTKAGTGTLVLAVSGGNSYSGGTFVQNGTLQVGAFNALPAAGIVTLGDTGNDSGVLDLNGSSITIAGLSSVGTGAGNIIASSTNSVQLTISGGSSTFGGIIADNLGTNNGQSTSLFITGGATLALAGVNTYSGATTIDTGSTLKIGGGGASGSINTASSLTDNGTLTFNRSDSSTFASVINGSGTVVQGGAGTTVLTAMNVYTGITTINTGGTLQIDNGGTTGTLGGGVSGGVGTSNVTDSGTLVFDRGDSPTYAGVISGNGSVQQIGAGVLTLAGANTYSGTTLIGAGSTLRVSTSASLGTLPGGAVTIASGGTLDLSGDATVNNLNFTTKQFNIAGTGVGGVGAIYNPGVSQEGFAENVTLTADASVSGVNTGGVFANNIGRIDIGRNGGTLNLNGHTLTETGNAQLSFTQKTVVNGNGNVVVSSGLLSIETTASVLAANVNSIVYQSGSIAGLFNNTAGDVTAPMYFNGANIQVGNDSNGTATIGSPMFLNNNVTVGGLAAFTGGVVLTGNIGDVTSPLTVPVAVPAGSGAITKIGASLLTLSGTNTYSGGTTINQGTVRLGSNGGLPSTGTVTFGNSTTSGTLDLGGFNATVGGLAVGSGAAAASQIIGSSSTTTASTLTFIGGISTFGGTIQNVIGTGNQTVALAVSSGSLTLTGANTYSGGTTINGGVLSVSADANLGASTGALSINGGTLQVTGTSYTTLDTTIRPFTWSPLGGSFDIADPGNTFIVNYTGSSPFTGGPITKLGAGTLAVDYTTSGTTTISAGTLVINGTGNTIAGISGAGQLTVAGGVHGTPGVISDGFQGGGSLNVTGAMQIRNNGTATGTSSLTSLTFGASGSLDLTNNKLILESNAISKPTAIAAVRSEVASGQIFDTGIPTNFGIAVVDNALVSNTAHPIGFTTFGGQAVDSNSILVSQELLGDANLDGQVTLSDLATVLNSFGQQPKWTNGGFGSGAVGLSDLADVLNNFGQHNANPSDSEAFSSAVIATPEPTSLALLGLGAVALMSRRRKA